jgi:hypothetical protein
MHRSWHRSYCHRLPLAGSENGDAASWRTFPWTGCGYKRRRWRSGAQRGAGLSLVGFLIGGCAIQT